MVKLVDKKKLNRKIAYYKNGSLRHYDVRKILVSRLRFMGDIILTTPIVAALKKRFPESEIDYLAEPPYIDLLQNHPSVTNLFVFDRAIYSSSTFMKNIHLQWNLIKTLRNRKYDVAIDLFGIPRSAWLLKCTKAPIRIGGCFRYRSHLYSHCFSTNQDWRTAVDFHNLSLKRIGIYEALEPPKIYLTTSELNWAKQYLAQKDLDLAKPIIGIHPGATWPAKIWPRERFVQLAKKIVNELKLPVFFTFGPEDEKISDAIRAETGSNIFIGDVLPLRKLASVLACFSVYISNDCGPMHLAPAVGTSTLGIFGPSIPEIWFNYKKEDGHRLIIKDIDCRPCHQHECPIQHQCMDWISVDEVFKNLTEVLENGSKI